MGEDEVFGVEFIAHESMEVRNKEEEVRHYKLQLTTVIIHKRKQVVRQLSFRS